MSESILTNRNGLSAIPITNAQITLLSNTLPFTGTEQSPQIKSVTLNGTSLAEGRDYIVINDNAINVGDYLLKIIGYDKYEGFASIPWTVSKPIGTITPNVENITVKGVMGTQGTFTFEHTGDGKISVESENGLIATATLFDNTVTVTSVKAGDTNVIICMSDSQNYKGTIVKVPIYVKRADASIAFSSEESIILGVMGTHDTSISATTTSDGVLIVENLNPEYCTATIQNGKLDIMSIKPSEFQIYIRVKVAATENYEAAYKDLRVQILRAIGDLTIKGLPSGTVEITGPAGTEMEFEYEKVGDGAITFQDTQYIRCRVEGQKIILTSVAEGFERVVVQLEQTDNYEGTIVPFTVRVVFQAIYGVSYDGTASTKLSRTDRAENFDDPVPALGGVLENTGSPFDDCYPWNGMTRETINGSEMVKIPKFYFKFTDNGEGKFDLQIAKEPYNDDFHISPAHADREDGCGERDYVYVGRYHCASDWKSKTGESPKVSQTRAQFRTGVKTLGTGWYMMDWPMWATIQMLYLVEFADFDAQKVIGYGCGNNSKVEAMGYTDSMSYHTGTTKSNRTTYGVSTQYRWIEGLWDNCLDWIDGITLSSQNAYASMDIKNYSDSTSGYTNVGKFPSSYGYIKYMGIPTATGFEWAWYPKELGGSEGSYVSDNSGVGPSPCCCVGGYYGQYRDYGLFSYVGGSVSSYVPYIGSRPIYLPQIKNPNLEG